MVFMLAPCIFVNSSFGGGKNGAPLISMGSWGPKHPKKPGVEAGMMQ